MNFPSPVGPSPDIIEHPAGLRLMLEDPPRLKVAVRVIRTKDDLHASDLEASLNDNLAAFAAHSEGEGVIKKDEALLRLEATVAEASTSEESGMVLGCNLHFAEPACLST